MRKRKDLGGEHLTMPEVNSDSSDSEQEGWLVVSEVLRTFVSDVRNFPDVIASSFSFRCWRGVQNGGRHLLKIPRVSC